MADELDLVKRAKAICERCEGVGSYTYWFHPNGRQDDASEERLEQCPDCNASGMIPVGVFEMVCARHCQFCDGQDHHWSYDGAEDTEGNALMGCRHCAALRPMEEADAYYYG